MKNYPNKVYLSTSWHQSDKALSSYIVNILIEYGLTVVGDHPDYQQDDPFDRAWTSRILKLVSDCSALVIIFPKRDEQQTTSPYIFPELLAADAHGIPILIFHDQGVLIKKTSTKQGYNLHFGGKKSNNSLTYEELFIEYKGNKEIDSKLNIFSTLNLTKTKTVEGPYELPSSTIDYKHIINDFINYKIKRVKSSFVFNVLPFSLKDKEHLEISKAVFEETGLPCYISLDSIGKSQKMREQWKKELLNSEFVIAEFSQLRDTCLFEAGVVLGMNKKIFLIAKKEPKLPYGLDDSPLKLYHSLDELNQIVKKDFCAEYKRKVYNFDTEIINLEQNKNEIGGIPDWFYKNNNKFNPILKLSISSWIFSISISLFIWSLFVFFGSTDSPATFFGLALSFIFGLGSHLRAIRTYFESKYLEKINYIVNTSIVLLILSIISVIYVYYRLPTTTS